MSDTSTEAACARIYNGSSKQLNNHTCSVDTQYLMSHMQFCCPTLSRDNVALQYTRCMSHTATL